MATIFYPSYTNVSYHPTGNGHEYQVLNIFYPTGTAPAGGWPVLIHTNLTGFGEGPPFPTISSDTTNKRQALAYQALAAGFAVVSIGLTGAGTNSSSRNGGGLFHPPGSPTGRYEDDSYPMCVKDTTWAIQFVRYYASLYNLNANKIITCGYSSGSISFAWPSLGPDRADPTKTDFRTASSRPNAVILHNHQSWFEAFSSGTANILSVVYPDTGNFLASGDWATSFSQAPYPPGYMNYPRELSDLYYGFLSNTTGLNANLPVYINSEFAGTYPISDTGLDLSGFPSLTNTLTNVHDPWWSAMLRSKLLSLDEEFHATYSRYTQYTGGSFTGGYGETSTRLDPGTNIIDTGLMIDIVEWMSGMFYTPPDPRPEYWRDLYGDATIAWVPPVTNYIYNDNLSKRGINDRKFRWQEVSIDLESVQEGAILDFISPDYYMIQITPDLHWHDQLAMFGETRDPDIFNPHLINLGPFSISNGSLTHGVDNSASIELTTGQMESAIIDGYSKYLWRAVPWGQGNPGMGGFPASFEWVSSASQIKFVVDPIKKDSTKSNQIISGTKGTRVTITVESENSPTVFVEQTSTTWKIIFAIDRSNIKFKIIATDEGGSATVEYPVDITYDLNSQIYSHVWNAFDGFALLASLNRLPDETNASLKNRIIDAFTNKGGTHYNGLINSINRDLGLKRKDNAIRLKRYRNSSNAIESSVNIESTHTRISVGCGSFIEHDEIQKIDSYNNTVKLNNRIQEIISIYTINGQEIPKSDYSVKTGDGLVEGNTVSINPRHSGLVKITYSYKEDIFYRDYQTVIQVIHALNEITNSNNDPVLIATIDPKMSGSELSKYLFHSTLTINNSNPEVSIGWSPIGLFSISDMEYKWSFANYNSTFFDSEFYNFVAELKSKTNIEWGFVVADKDYWDAVDSKTYGNDSLPIACDIPLSKYVTVMPTSDRTSFDPWQAHRMSYYYDNVLIKNHGFAQKSFRSGVGYKRDCAVASVNKVFTSDTIKINLNQITSSPADFINNQTGKVVDI